MISYNINEQLNKGTLMSGRKEQFTSALTPQEVTGTSTQTSSN